MAAVWILYGLRVRLVTRSMHSGHRSAVDDINAHVALALNIQTRHWPFAHNALGQGLRQR